MVVPDRLAQPADRYLTPAYTDLLQMVHDRLVPNHEIQYLPHAGQPEISDMVNLTFATEAELPAIVSSADAIICISRDEERNPDYNEQYPDHNIVLTSCAKSNVDRSVELFRLARGTGNETAELVVTGRMHNRAIDMMVALPAVCEFIGINHEDAYYVSEASFRTLLERALSRRPEDNPDVFAQTDQEIRDFAAGLGIVSEAALAPESNIRRTVADELTAAFAAYPRISTSRLMYERARAAGVPLESMYEEDNAVDTITNILYSLERLRETAAHHVVIVAGSDQLPRTMWIADHILPDGITITCVESDPTLNPNAYDASCVRERQSFLKGSQWIGGSRNPEDIDAVVDAGYFGPSRRTSAQVAAHVAAAALDEAQ